MLNNKGQSLVMFVLVLPLLIIILMSVYLIGKISLLKSEIDDINYLALSYALTNNEIINEDNIREMIVKNKSDIDSINIRTEDDIIYIRLEKKIINNKSFVSNLSFIEISSDYRGYIDQDNKIIIERNN